MTSSLASITGILMPAFSNRFMIRYGQLRECTKEAADLLSLQTVSLDFDLAADEYVLKIQQPMASSSEFLDVIRTMCQHGFKIKAELLDGDVTVTGCMLEGMVWVKKHHAALDYREVTVITHTLTLGRGYKKLD